jgi:hypothetical protein
MVLKLGGKVNWRWVKLNIIKRKSEDVLQKLPKMAYVKKNKIKTEGNDEQEMRHSKMY